MARKHLRAFLGLALGAAVPVSAAAAPPAGVCGACVAVKVASCGGFLEAPAIAPDGSLFVADVTGGQVLRIDSAGRCTVAIRTGGHPNGMRFRSDGKLLIADHKGLLLFDPLDGSLVQLPFAYNGEQLVGLNDIAIDHDGGLYITVPGRSSALSPTGKVYYMSPAGAVRLVYDAIAFPNGIAAMTDGSTVLVSEFTAKRVLALPSVNAPGPFAVPYVFALTQGGIGLDGMALDAAGRLFGASFGSGEVVVYDRQARLLGAIALPPGAGDMVTNIVLNSGYLYITEAGKGEVWRVRLLTD